MDIIINLLCGFIGMVLGIFMSWQYIKNKPTSNINRHFCKCKDPDIEDGFSYCYTCNLHIK